MKKKVYLLKIIQTLIFWAVTRTFDIIFKFYGLDCEIKANCIHVGPGPARRVLSVGVILRDPNPYLHEFHWKPRKSPNRKVDKHYRESNTAHPVHQFWGQKISYTKGAFSLINIFYCCLNLNLNISFISHDFWISTIFKISQFNLLLFINMYINII